MKMKRIGVAVLSLSMGILVSCKDQASEANPTESDVEIQENPKTTASVNPEHGQPGHDCSVPVGAPLGNSNQVSRSSEVNPPHGEPGHDCTVPVGAPLNSGSTPSSSSSSSNISPIRVNKSPEVNPPHGEPGHDCTVPVGAPLEN